MIRKITIISGTNRENSHTKKVAKYYEAKIKEMGKETRFLDLKELVGVIDLNAIYDKNKSEAFSGFITEFISGADAFVFVVPEYNGSFPGVVKVLLDAVPPSNWANKEVCLTGVSTGRAGNLRGMEHLTGVLMYLKLHIYHDRLPISQIDKILVNGETIPEETGKLIEKQLEGFLKS